MKVSSKDAFLSAKDWLEADQKAWEAAGVDEKINFVRRFQMSPSGVKGKTLAEQNSNNFVKAVLHNTKSPAGFAEYFNVKQRHLCYSVVSYFLYGGANKSESIRLVRFFAAATMTTGPGGILEAESIFAKLFLLNSKTIEFLIRINELLFEHNMPIMRQLLHTWKSPRSPLPGKGNVKLHPLEFDIHMVFFEQSHVQKYLVKNRSKITKSVRGDFADNLMDAASWEINHLPIKQVMEWALRALKKQGTVLDFMNFKERVFLGIATIYRLHGKTEEEYQKRVISLKNVQPIKV